MFVFNSLSLFDDVDLTVIFSVGEQITCSPAGELQCAFGVCLEGIDGANATCSCFDGYEGTFCETRK